MKIISDLLTHKYGKQYAEACRSDSIATISDKLRHKMSVQSPPKLLVEKYLIEIAKNYSIPYEPDPEVMKGERGVDALLDIGERNDTNNLGGGGGGMPQPPGFIGFPQPPLLPVNPGMGGGYTPFNYPVSKFYFRFLFHWKLLFSRKGTNDKYNLTANHLTLVEFIIL